ncbi:hypothetical protein M569_03988, partial [Genlisea aurea]
RAFHDSDSTLKLIPQKNQLSWKESLLNDASRIAYLARSIVPIASGRAVTLNPTYIVRATIGTPPQTLLLALDTSNDVAWVPTTGCSGCSAASDAVAYNPSKSTTFKPVNCGSPQCNQVPNPSCGGASCGFNLTYGVSTVAAGLSQDNITLATDSISGYTFGVIRNATGSSLPSQGLLGLGRGPLSLLAQTSSLYQSTFSYCLPNYKSTNFNGSLRLGPSSQPNRAMNWTQLLRSPRRLSFYYVNLVGIKVGRRGVSIPPAALAFDPNTGAGTIFDSGVTFTTLVKPAYTAVRDEFRRQMGNATVSSLGGFDTCYTVPVAIPTMTLVFSGLNVSLRQDNFLIHSTAGTISCLAMAAAPEGSIDAALNVIGTFQQQNHRIVIDVPNSKVAVAREQCS